jgi:hypothetical protein
MRSTEPPSDPREAAGLVESEPVVEEPVREGELVFLWRCPPGDSAPRPTASPALVVAEEPKGDKQCLVPALPCARERL